MPFAFNFTFTVPGISNPFSAASQSKTGNESNPLNSSCSTPTLTLNGNPAHQLSRPPPPLRRSPSPLPPAPTSRKRGWAPSSSELSHASTVQTLSSGYLDTPAKYRDMAGISDQDQGQDLMEGELPAPKRRKTLASSIVSTALSAALIGTAVGLTVYRLWRDRGREPEALPPPPYQESESSFQQENVPSISVVTQTPRSKRHRTITGRRNAAQRHRKQVSRVHMHTQSGSFSPSTSTTPSAPFDLIRSGQQEDENEEADDQMDWIGGRISKLIEEGKKALGAEVVVMSDSKEDEVDDGSQADAWEEDDQSSDTSHFSRHRKGTAQHLSLVPSYSHHRRLSSPPSPGVMDSSRPTISNSSAEPESPNLGSPTWQEGESDWQSVEIKASMERARALYLSKARR